MFNLRRLDSNSEEEIRDLLKKIKEFEENAKEGKSNKKIRNNLLFKIDAVDKSANKIIQDYYEFNPDDERIKILGAYELYSRYKK